MEVFIALKRDYEGSEIVGVFYSERTAKRLLLKMSKESKSDYYGYAIEVWELGDTLPTYSLNLEVKGGRRAWVRYG